MKLHKFHYHYYCLVHGGMEYKGIVLLIKDRYVVSKKMHQPIEDNDCVISKEFLSEDETFEYFLSNIKD